MLKIMEEHNIMQILDIINVLVKPNSDGIPKVLIDVLKSNIEEVQKINTQIVNEFNHLKTYCKLEEFCHEDICWQYVCVCLETLLCLKEQLQKNEDELLSVSHQKSVKGVFELVVSMGLLPYLLKGVGFGLDQRCANASLYSSCINVANLPDVDKYYRLCGVVRSLLSLTDEKAIGALFLTKHLEDLLAALCQLTIPRFKHPNPDLISDREYFQEKMTHLISTTYQPFVINALMFLRGNKGSPGWLRAETSKLLTQRFLQKNGVINTIKAIQHTVCYENPNVITGLESIARLITTPHTKDAAEFYSIIAPQILQLVHSEDSNFMRIGVLCCRVLYEKDKSVFDQHIMSVLSAPFINFSSSYSESEITQSIHWLHKCFAIPDSDMWFVPLEPLLHLSKIIYSLYCKICDSALIIKKPVEDLLWVILSKSNDEKLKLILLNLLLNEVNNEIKEIPDNVTFVFGDEGGVKISIGDKDLNENIQYSKCILKLLEEKDLSGKIRKTLFITLLNYSNKLGNEISINKIYIIEMLAELSENELVQKSISSNSDSIIDFIDSLVKNKIESGDGSVEILCIALVLLISIMNNMPSSSNWDKLQKLSASLPKLNERTNSIELKMLCDEIYNMILTRGVIKSVKSEKFSNKTTSSSSKPNYKSLCEKALEEACDPLLPVRGHAMIELAKLISSGDSEAKAKKNGILCIFQENLKNEDSYIYLTAIEGMASLASEFPDTILVALAEEYSRTETTTRLKVGEALMRVVRRLGDMVPVYKNELLNSFLNGVRDTDNLVRASSLSNIGELCQILSFRIGPIAVEIFNCVESVVSTDLAPEPRRAAVMLVTSVLRGLQSDALTVLEPVLLPLYRTLKKIYQTDKDEVVRLHSQLAIEELNSATCSVLFPTEKIEKRIFILDPPS